MTFGGTTTKQKVSLSLNCCENNLVHQSLLSAAASALLSGTLLSSAPATSPWQPAGQNNHIDHQTDFPTAAPSTLPCIGSCFLFLNPVLISYWDVTPTQCRSQVSLDRDCPSTFWSRGRYRRQGGFKTHINIHLMVYSKDYQLQNMFWTQSYL